MKPTPATQRTTGVNRWMAPAMAQAMAWAAATIIAAMPFHAFLSVWLSQVVGHYTAVRLWKEVVLLGLFVGLLYLAVTQAKVRAELRGNLLVRLITAYILLLLFVGLVALSTNGVTLKAFAYGMLLDTRFLVFFVVTWVITLYTDLLVRLWRRLLLIPAAIVVGFATLQYAVLPTDWLRHFGYGPNTIPAMATIDQKDAYQRVQATLRGPNPFGAYVVVVLTALGAVLLKGGRNWYRSAVLYVLSLLALFFTFSRSAWLGATLSSGLLIWFSLKSARLRRGLLVAVSAGVLVFAGIGYVLRDNDNFQNVFFHTNEHSRSSESSNSGHYQAIMGGLDDIGREPLGGGTGTAGPASVYNSGSEPRIAENYYVQIGQEAGILATILFMAINAVVALQLWRRRQDRLACVLLVSLAGITLINLLSHAWTDDTLAYIWWGLAGAALSGNVSGKISGNDETTA